VLATRLLRAIDTGPLVAPPAGVRASCAPCCTTVVSGELVTGSTPPPFDVLICHGPDRLSRRDGDESFADLKAISKAGVQVWFYSDGTYFRYGMFESNVTGFLKGEFAAEYRRTVSQKTTESHLRKARLGHGAT
jgi:DNA invertase Pin-like site-specific DNA recombinase